jgi:phosphate-selective porin OprO/OprP
MAVPRSPYAPRSLRQLSLATIAASLLAVLAGPAQAQSSVFDDLLERLKEKGVLSQDEYDALKAARDEENMEQRAERRRQALREAQEAEKQEKAKEEAKTTLKGKFANGFVFETEDKENRLQFSGRVQADYRNFSDDIAADTFDIRRAFLTGQGQIAKYYTFDITADFASSSGSPSSFLDVAWLNAAWWKPVQFRIGQYKMPFSMDELTSDLYLDYLERDIGNPLVPAKTRGVMVHGAPLGGLTYALAYSNLNGKNANDVNQTVDGKEVIGRVTGNFAQFFSLKDSVLHLGGAFTDGTIPTVNASSGTTANNAAPTFRTEARGVNFFTPTAFTGEDVQRRRYGLEAAVALGPVKLQGEYITSNYQGTSGTGADYDKDLKASYLSASWLISGEQYASSYKDGGWGRIIPKSNFALGGGGWGAWELGLRYSQFDGTDFGFVSASNPAGTGAVNCAVGAACASTLKANAWTLGLKWIMTPNTRLMLNYVQTNFDTPVTFTPAGGTTAGTPQSFDEEQAIIFRGQLDF